MHLIFSPNFTNSFSELFPGILCVYDSYLVGTAISPNLSYLLAASTAIPVNTHKVKRKPEKKHCKLSQALCSIIL